MLKAPKTRLYLSNSYLSLSPVAFMCFNQMYVLEKTKQNKSLVRKQPSTSPKFPFHLTQFSTQILQGKVPKFEVKTRT